MYSRGGGTEGKKDMIDKGDGYSFFFCLQQVLLVQLLSHSCNVFQKYNLAVIQSKEWGENGDNLFVKLVNNI
jgi:hypothetical protein